MLLIKSMNQMNHLYFPKRLSTMLLSLLEVIDPVTDEKTLIPKTDSSYYDAGGYKARKYKGSSKPPDCGKPLLKRKGRRPLKSTSLKRLGNAF